ncbi:hypothetical protein GGI19_005861 [Coemansia pectinata]|uniref:Uncharacterized protein n=1 Tax=Coemansia pectinata TaxID=1052879 RepID=A0A9W8L8R1_9FUNG|nr:hypothetical protein GGI19_005861 [Coemansia pectinata]
MGLYRIVNHEGQAFASVMCNPLPSIPLVHSDSVYVLGPDIPGWRHVSEGLRVLKIAPQTTAFNSESVSPTSSAATGKSDQGTDQSRHTVYSHNTVPSSLDADADADADVSDMGT